MEGPAGTPGTKTTSKRKKETLPHKLAVLVRGQIRLFSHPVPRRAIYFGEASVHSRNYRSHQDNTNTNQPSGLLKCKHKSLLKNTMLV